MLKNLKKIEKYGSLKFENNLQDIAKKSRKFFGNEGTQKLINISSKNNILKDLLY